MYTKVEYIAANGAILDLFNDEMFDLVDDLGALCDNGIPIFPGHMIVNSKELYRIVNYFFLKKLSYHKDCRDNCVDPNSIFQFFADIYHLSENHQLQFHLIRL